MPKMNRLSVQLLEQTVILHHLWCPEYKKKFGQIRFHS